MRINIQTKNLELSDAIRKYTEDKVESFSKLLADEADPVVDVELAKVSADQHSGDQLYRAEVNLTVLGKQVYVEAGAPDLYAAIDEVKDKTLRELRQDKEKSSEAQRAGGREAKALLRGE